MDECLLPLPPASHPLSRVVGESPGSEQASSGDTYREFIRRASAELAAVPDTVMSLWCGGEFRALRPELHDRVRQGQEQFGRSAEQVYDDLVVSCAARRRVLPQRLRRWIIRGAKRLFLVLKVAWLWWVVFRLTSWRMRGRPVDATLKTPPSGCGSRRKGPPLASIVVLSHDRLPYLQITIGALRETVGECRHEVIVVDNGSHDGSVEFLCECRRRGIVDKLILLPENLGISAGYNHGFAVADGRCQYLMKLDSDIKILSRDWLAAAAEFLSTNHDVGFIALNQVNHLMLRMLPVLRRGKWELMDFAEWTVGSAMIIPVRVKKELGCFIEDPELTYAPDDIDYYVRASRKGYRTFIMKKLLVYHQMDRDDRDYREYTRAKPVVQSSHLAIRLAAQYDRGLRPLEVHYEKYRRATEWAPWEAGSEPNRKM